VSLLVAAAALLLGACGGGGTARHDMSAMSGDTTTTTTTTTTVAAESCLAGGDSLTLVASGTKFDVTCLDVPADTALNIVYDNRDNTGHSLAVVGSRTSTEVLFRSDIIGGPATTTLSVPPLQAGTYVFQCEVHPSQMRGTFIVE